MDQIQLFQPFQLTLQMEAKYSVEYLTRGSFIRWFIIQCAQSEVKKAIRSRLGICLHRQHL